jgi:hypothetical protein
VSTPASQAAIPAVPSYEEDISGIPAVQEIPN